MRFHAIQSLLLFVAFNFVGVPLGIAIAFGVPIVGILLGAMIGIVSEDLGAIIGGLIAVVGYVGGLLFLIAVGFGFPIAFIAETILCVTGAQGRVPGIAGIADRFV